MRFSSNGSHRTAIMSRSHAHTHTTIAFPVHEMSPKKRLGSTTLGSEHVDSSRTVSATQHSNANERHIVYDGTSTAWMYVFTCTHTCFSAQFLGDVGFSLCPSRSSSSEMKDLNDSSADSSISTTWIIRHWFDNVSSSW